MDILVSSNVERLVFEMSGRDSAKVRNWMQDLREKGVYKVDKETLKNISDEFRSAYAGDEEVGRPLRKSITNMTRLLTLILRWRLQSMPVITEFPKRGLA